MRNVAQIAQRPVNRRALGLLQSLILALLLSVAAFLGVFTAVEGRLYDIFVTHGPGLHSAPRQVVLIDSPVVTFFNPSFAWVKLTDDLLALGAQQVVFTVIPEGDPQVTAALLGNPRVVLGSDIAPDPARAGSQVFNVPPTLRSAPNAVADTPEPLLGLHRYQWYSYPVGDRVMPSVEALAARRLGRDIPKEGSFLINFGGADRAFPRVRLQQVVEGRLIKEVVQGRVVVIGIGKERFHRDVVTPITTDTREVPKLEYHGFALDSLLNGNAIGSMLPIAKAALLLSVWLLYFLVAQPMSFRAAVVTGAVMSVALVLLAWGILVGFNLHVPVVGSILVIGTTLISIFQHKANHHDRVLERLVNSANLAHDERLKAQMTPEGEEFWPYALGMVDQAVPITRAVLFERVPGTSRLRLVHSLRCSADAVGAGESDLAQEPFASAVRAGDVVETRDLLKPIEGESLQYIAPLVSQGECVGCLAFGMGSAGQNMPTLLRAASALSRRLAEMVMHNQRAAVEAVAGGTASALRRYLSDKRNDTVTALGRHLQLAQRHSEFLEAVLHRLLTPTIVYDLFGRPLFANNRMKAAMKEISPAEDRSATAADLIEHACGLSSHQARLALTAVTIDGDSFDHPAWTGVRQLRLHADTLGGTTLAETTYEDMLQEAHGLLFQLLPQDGGPQPATTAAQPGKPDAEQELDLWPCLESAAARVSRSGEFEGLSIVLEGDRTPATVRAVPRPLEDLLTAVLQLLAYDAQLPGQIVVLLMQRDRLVEINLRNAGFGMPHERLQAMLDGPIWPQSPTLRRVRQLRGSSLGENGALTISSAVGTGYRATLSLQRVA